MDVKSRMSRGQEPKALAHTDAQVWNLYLHDQTWGLIPKYPRFNMIHRDQTIDPGITCNSWNNFSSLEYLNLELLNPRRSQSQSQASKTL